MEIVSLARCWCFIWGKETFIRVSLGKTLKKNHTKARGETVQDINCWVYLSLAGVPSVTSMTCHLRRVYDTHLTRQVGDWLKSCWTFLEAFLLAMSCHLTILCHSRSHWKHSHLTGLDMTG